MIPLVLKLKRARHKEVARAQDLIIEELYHYFEKAVLHGGTAIWRCYNGNRFSEDIDVCITKDEKRINEFFDALKKDGFNIKKKKISEKSIFSVMELNGTEVRFEAIFERVEGSLKEYETADGNFVTIYALRVEEIINEKIDAYMKRLKIRDIYDIFFLLRYVTSKQEVSRKLRLLLENLKEPIDAGELKVLIIEGIVPNTEKIIEYIKRWL